MKFTIYLEIRNLAQSSEWSVFMNHKILLTKLYYPILLAYIVVEMCISLIDLQF